MCHKKIYDSLHRFIRVDELENKLIDSIPFQRLNYIHQLGMAYLVYPGGTHKRFEHSLGVMEIASSMYDKVTGSLPKGVQSPHYDVVPRPGTKEHAYWRRVLRLAALCHDMGHLPFSHSAEHLLLGNAGHEGWTKQVIESSFLRPIFDELNTLLPERNTTVDVMKTAIGRDTLKKIAPEYAQFTAWERVVSDIITADFFGADRIDYLLRDAQYTGLSYGIFDYHQLIETLAILPSPDANPEHALELGIDENGVESAEALLLSRYFLHKRLCQYPSVKAYCFHAARFLASNCRAFLEKASVNEYLQLNDSEIVSMIHKASRNEDAVGFEDASILLKQQKRYTAVALKSALSAEKMNAIAEECLIPPDKIAWEVSEESERILSLNFPVLQKSGEVVSGETLSDITIPQNPVHWLFVHAEHAEKIFPQLSSQAKKIN